MSLKIVPPATAEGRLVLQRAVASLRQQGRDPRSFAQFFWTMARGLEYDDAVLKEVFNLILDDPLPRWEMEQLHVLNFWEFSLYVHHRKDWQILNPPDVCSEHPTLLPPSSQVHDHLLTPTEKRRNRRKRAAQVAASASESAPASPEPVESAPASPEPVESAPASPESVESAPASPESVESAPASPESVEFAPASPESVEFAPASPESVEFAPASPESVQFTPVSPESVEFTPVTPESVNSVQILPVWVKVSSVIPEIERVAVTPEAANDTHLSPQRCKRRAHIVQSNALISEVPSTLVQEGLNPEVSDPLAQEGPSQVPPSSVVPEDLILMVRIPVVQEDQSRESSNPLVQEGLYQEAPSSEVQESLSQEVANQVVQEDQTQLIMYSVVPDVYSLEPTSKPPTPPAKPVLKENETALSELFMRPVLSKVDPLISSVASTETVLDLTMEAIPEHLTLPVMAMEATSEQRANPVLALETLSKHSCLPAKATETILGLSSSLVITTETEPASHVSSSGSAPALVMEPFSSGSQRRWSLSLPVLTLIFPALLPCLVRDSLCTALQTKILWINWSLNAIDTIETWVSGNLTALTERLQPAIRWRVGEVANRVSCGSFRGGHWYLPIRNHDNRYFADWIRLFPGLSKNSENGNSCPKPHKAARMIEAVGRAVSIETEL